MAKRKSKRETAASRSTIASADELGRTPAPKKEPPRSKKPAAAAPKKRATRSKKPAAAAPPKDVPPPESEPPLANPLDGERARDASRKRQSRAAGKNVEIPACKDPARRARLEADDLAWLLWYFGEGSGCPDPYWYQFTEQQQAMAVAIRQAIEQGVDQAIAATRGEGKSTLGERLLIKYTLSGKLKLSVLLSATRELANDSLETIRQHLETNERLLADYPELCVPIRALEGTPNRAHYMTASGRRHDNGQAFAPTPCRFKWCGKEIVLPEMPGAPGAGAIIVTRGLEKGAIRGMKKRGRRVDLVVIDDPDTEQTARDEDAAKKLVTKIDRALALLGGQQKNVARVMLTTLQSRASASYTFTDPEQKPGWNPLRFRFLIAKPEHPELWEEYVALRLADLADYALKRSTDRYCRRAHLFYLEHFEEMNAGARVANEHRYNASVIGHDELPKLKGEPKYYRQLEVTALQHYYNEVARIGAEAVATELDNDPPEELGAVESGITASHIQRRCGGYERRRVPPGTVVITRGVDCGKYRLHWVERAWLANGSGYTIDYGVHEVSGTSYGTDAGTDLAVKRAVLELIETRQDLLQAADGEILPVARTLIDAGYKTTAIYEACRDAGGTVSPIMGFGRSEGCVEASFSEVQHSSRDRRVGKVSAYFLSRKGTTWLVCAAADKWKAWEHDRWMTPADKSGAMQLFGVAGGEHLSPDERSHLAYAKHLVGEVEVEEPYQGGIRRRWKTKSHNQHWLDASYYSDVAAAMEGVPMVGMTPSLAAALASQVKRQEQRGRAPRSAGHAAPGSAPATPSSARANTGTGWYGKYKKGGK